MKKTSEEIYRELNVIAYLGIIKDELLPSRLLPIQKLKRPPFDILIPPYVACNGKITDNLTIVSESDLENMIRFKDATRLDSPIQAIYGYKLWVDDQRIIRYQPKKEVENFFKSYSRIKAQDSREAFDKGDYDLAITLAQRSLCADESNSAGPRVMLEVYKTQGNQIFTEEIQYLIDSIERPQ